MTTSKKQRLTIFLEPSLVTQAKIQAIIEKLSLTAFVEKILVLSLPKKIVIKKLVNR